MIDIEALSVGCGSVLLNDFVLFFAQNLVVVQCAALILFGFGDQYVQAEICSSSFPS